MFSHDLPFDPAYGHTLETLLAIEPPDDEPADLEAFWRERFDAAAAVRLNLATRPSPLSTETVEVSEVEYDSLGGFRVFAWLTRPRGVEVHRGVVKGHGYGGRTEPEVRAGDPPAATLFPCARGLGRSACETIPGDGQEHVVHGIADRDAYVHLGCCADLVWCAASALIELAPETAGKLDFSAGSFGGGIGALALPWDPRYRRARLDVPSFGHHPLRMTLEMTGSGAGVNHYAADHPEVVDVLRYYDAAVNARRLSIPTLVANALFDPAVPPPGQFAVYNAIPAGKRLYVAKAGHFPHDDEWRDVRNIDELSAVWFGTPTADGPG